MKNTIKGTILISSIQILGRKILGKYDLFFRQFMIYFLSCAPFFSTLSTIFLKLTRCSLHYDFSRVRYLVNMKESSQQIGIAKRL